MKPLLAFTAGDPGGVGPEVAVAALRSAAVRRACRPLAVGPRAAFERAGWRPGISPLLDVGPACRRPARAPSAEGGRASYESVRACLRLAARGLIDGMVTAPASKRSWALAGVPHLDHTDLLKAETGARRVGMLLTGGGLRAILATRHVPLARVPRLLSLRELSEAADLARQGLALLGFRSPRLGLCALNPHAGDGGLIGSEERRLLKPAARRLRLAGPLPADAAWAAHAAGRYDALVALYHDQALIPLKLRCGYGVVNWTLGVPVTRTAPGHGTAYDLAGRGEADPSGMIAAALLAAQVAARRPPRGIRPILR